MSGYISGSVQPLHNLLAPRQALAQHLYAIHIWPPLVSVAETGGTNVGSRPMAPTCKIWEANYLCRVLRDGAVTMI